jgi:ATP-dependent Clp endopeptidase proteolytic subunit ClpP
MATPELNIDGAIGAGWYYEGITVRYVKSWLRDNAKAEEIRLLINSPGGDVFHGLGIYTALKKFQGRVVAEVESLSASAASFLMMAADEIQIHKGAFVMIHEPWTFTMGNASEHERQAAFLSKINLEVADIYAARTGQPKDEILKWLADETWMTADEATDRGFSDKTLAAKTKTKEPKRDKAAKAVASYFRHAPAAIASMFGVSSKPQSMLDRIEMLTELEDPRDDDAQQTHAHTAACGHPGVCPEEQPEPVPTTRSAAAPKAASTIKPFPVAAAPLGELAARTARIGG